MTGRAERRYTAVPVEARGTDGSGMKVGGYAAVFNRVSQNLGGFVEQVGTGAFNDARSHGWPDVMARYNHDDNMLLGTTGGGTLTLSVDRQGLQYEVVVPQSRSDVYELVTRGDIRKSSFAFRVLPDGDEWATTDQGYPLRTVQNLQLIDVAPVNSPAYTDTTVKQRANFVLEEARGALESLAVKMEADLEEVRKLAAEDELRRFFIRTDTGGRMPPKPMSAAAAASIIAGRMADTGV